MTLSFTQTINGKPNYFIEKIWKALILYNLSSRGFVEFCYQPYFKKFGETVPMSATLFPKLHTIRLDPHIRWKPGMDIHPVINNRTANRFQFAPVIKCVGVQEIEIKYTGMIVTVFIDGKDRHTDIVTKLAINDGFENIADFFAYFNKDFTGKIIHWTDLKY